MTRPVRAAAVLAITVAVAGYGLIFSAGASADAAAKTGQVYIIQGVPGATVDVERRRQVRRCNASRPKRSSGR